LDITTLSREKDTLSMAGSRRMRKEPCAFCGAVKAGTKDHVPPKAIFPEKLPIDINMVTAPACDTCHGISMKDDTTIRNLLISPPEAEEHPAVTSGLADRRDRSLERVPTDFQKLLQTMKLVDIETPAGIYLGTRWALDLDNPTMNRFVERLSRALLWYEFRQIHFEGVFDWRMNRELPGDIYAGIKRFGGNRLTRDSWKTTIVT
jgi:hypothetical protein